MTAVAGFTLVELLVVISILVALSFLAYGAYAKIQEDTNEQLAQTRLARLAQAMNRFQADMGYYPGQGPLKMTGNCATGTLQLPAAAAGAANPGQWAQSPANLWMLFEKPVFCAGHPLTYLATWNPRTSRGWNGPYLPPETIEWVRLDGEQDFVPAWSAGNAHPPGSGVLAWKRTKDGQDIAVNGRPLTYYLNTTPDDPPHLIYWGADGRCGAGGSIEHCNPPTASSPGDCPVAANATADEKAACDNLVIQLRRENL